MLAGMLIVIICQNETVTGIGKEKGIANTEREVVKTGKNDSKNIFYNFDKFHMEVFVFLKYPYLLRVKFIV